MYFLIIILAYVWFGNLWIFQYTNLHTWISAGDSNRYILWTGIILLPSIVCFVISEKRNIQTAIVSIFAAYGILYVVAREGVLSFFKETAMVAIGYIIYYIVTSFILKKLGKFKSIFDFLTDTGKKVIFIMCLFMVGKLVVITVSNSASSVARIYREKKAISEVVSVEEDIFKNNHHILEKFTWINWEKMNNKEKEEACIQLAQLELLYLTGRKDDTLLLYVCDDHYEGAGGFFDEEKNRIILDERYIDILDYIVNAVCHESFHYYQSYIVKGGTDIRELSDEEKIKKYVDELENYTDLGENYEKYYEQALEADARNYAEKAARMYLNYIYSNIE